MPLVTIRPLRSADAPLAAQVFFDAVREGTKEHYTEAQRRAWAGEPPDPESWRDRLTGTGMAGFAAEEGGQLVGFMTIGATGYIDLAFVAPSALGQGVGWRLYLAVEDKARELGASVLTTDASRMARPFFERQGWSVVAEQVVIIRDAGLTNSVVAEQVVIIRDAGLTNYRMRKAL